MSQEEVGYSQIIPYYDTVWPSKAVLWGTQDTFILDKTTGKRKRQLFYSDEKIASGMVFLEKLAQSTKDIKFPEWWREGDALRFGHSVQLSSSRAKRVSV